MANKIKQTIVVLVAMLGFASLVLPATSAFAAPVTCGPNESLLTNSTTVCCPNGANDTATSCTFAKYINPIVKVLSVLAGVAVVIGVIRGGIEYGASAGDPQKTAKAKGQIVKALVGLISFLFLYSAIQFLSPGGLASTNASSVSVSSGQPSVAQQCSKPFLGLKPWFSYLPNDSFKATNGTYSCTIQNFSLLGNAGSGSQIIPVVLAIADDLVRVAGFIAVAFVISGGIQYVTSQGEAEKTKKARETIINALVGVVIAIIAATLVSFLGSRLSV